MIDTPGFNRPCPAYHFREVKAGVDDFIQITVFCQPKRHDGAMVILRNAGKIRNLQAKP